MKRNNIKWKPEYEKWLMDHKDIVGKQKAADMLNAEFGTSFTPNAVSVKRSEIRAFSFNRYHINGHRGKWKFPLYSERVKGRGDYIQIKIADRPAVWWSKSKWVWVETHPGQPYDESDNFIFLDGDKYNFNPHNIYKVPARVMGILNRNFGGIKKGFTPEYSRMLIARAELKIALLDAGERIGIVKDYGSGRRFKADLLQQSKKSYYRKKERMKNNAQGIDGGQ